MAETPSSSAVTGAASHATATATAAAGDTTPQNYGAAAARRLLHTRQVEFRGYARDDGLWDIEAEMSDKRSYASARPGGEPPIAVGEPVHDMGIRVTVDDALTIVAIEPIMRATPMPECQDSRAPMQAMIGARMGGGWRRGIEERLGGTQGCAHMRELLFNMATAALQTIPVYRAQQVLRGELPDPQHTEPPGFLGRCKTWDFDSDATRRAFPRWFGWRAPGAPGSS